MQYIDLAILLHLSGTNSMQQLKIDNLPESPTNSGDFWKYSPQARNSKVYHESKVMKAYNNLIDGEIVWAGIGIFTLVICRSSKTNYTMIIKR